MGRNKRKSKSARRRPSHKSNLTEDFNKLDNYGAVQWSEDSEIDKLSSGEESSEREPVVDIPHDPIPIPSSYQGKPQYLKPDDSLRPIRKSRDRNEPIRKSRDRNEPI